MDSNFATKHDLKEVDTNIRAEIKVLDSELRSEMKEIEFSLRQEIKNLEHSIQNLETHLTIKLGGIMALGLSLMAILNKL